MLTNEMKEKVENEILERLIDDIEVDILRKKEELYKVGTNFVRTFAQDIAFNGSRFTSETQDKMDIDRKKYVDQISEMHNLIKLHNVVKNRQDEILETINGWLRKENFDLVKINNYIEESFNRDSLDDE